VHESREQRSTDSHHAAAAALRQLHENAVCGTLPRLSRRKRTQGESEQNGCLAEKHAAGGTDEQAIGRRGQQHGADTSTGSLHNQHRHRIHAQTRSGVKSAPNFDSTKDPNRNLDSAVHVSRVERGQVAAGKEDSAARRNKQRQESSGLLDRRRKSKKPQKRQAVRGGGRTISRSHRASALSSRMQMARTA
jgi:hypothetical protein